MSNWKTIEIGSKNSAKETEDSLNEDQEAEDNQDTDQDEEDTDETVDFSDEDVLVDEDTETSDEDSEESQEEQEADTEKKPSRAETRIRELANQKKAAEDRANRAMAELETVRREASENQKANLDSEILSTKARLDSVKKELKVAVEAGDTDALIKGQEELSRFNVQLMALESSKRTFDVDNKRTAPAKEQERTAQDIPQSALKWAERNDGWFNKNRALTGTALGINQDLLEEGFDPNSPAFYSELDKRLSPYKPRDTSPNAKKSAAEAQKPKTTQVVGASSKTVPPKSVKVTPKDQEFARRMGIDPKKYLMQKALYEKNAQNQVETFKSIIVKKDK